MKKKLIPAKDRPSTSISLIIHKDPLDKLKRVAVRKAWPGIRV